MDIDIQSLNNIINSVNKYLYNIAEVIYKSGIYDYTYNSTRSNIQYIFDSVDNLNLGCPNIYTIKVDNSEYKTTNILNIKLEHLEKILYDIKYNLKELIFNDIKNTYDRIICLYNQLTKEKFI